MAGFLDKILGYIGIEGEDLEDDYTQDIYEEDDYDNNVVTIGNRGKQRRAATSAPVQEQGNVVNFPSSAAAQMKMIVYHPISYEDTQNIIDNLKSRKPVIVNMEELELDCAQRILDFMAGAIYALNGTIYKISRGIFVVAPTNYDVIGNDESDYDGII